MSPANSCPLCRTLLFTLPEAGEDDSEWESWSDVNDATDGYSTDEYMTETEDSETDYSDTDSMSEQSSDGTTRRSARIAYRDEA